MTNLKQISMVKDKKLKFVVPQCWTFFSQSKVQCQLRHFEHCPKLTMPYRVSKPCSELLDMTQTCPTKMFKIDRNDPHWPEDTAQNCSKLRKIAQMAQIAQQVSKVYRSDVLVIHGCESCHHLALPLPVSIVAWA